MLLNKQPQHELCPSSQVFFFPASKSLTDTHSTLPLLRSRPHQLVLIGRAHYRHKSLTRLRPNRLSLSLLSLSLYLAPIGYASLFHYHWVCFLVFDRSHAHKHTAGKERDTTEHWELQKTASIFYYSLQLLLPTTHYTLLLVVINLKFLTVRWKLLSPSIYMRWFSSNVPPPPFSLVYYFSARFTLYSNFLISIYYRCTTGESYHFREKRRNSIFRHA